MLCDRAPNEFIDLGLKHIVGNEQETSRKPPRYLGHNHNQSVSSNIDDRTMHELYLWPFADAGFVVSDWFAHQSGLASALAGLDVVMPVAPLWSKGNLTAIVNNGSLPLERLDNMVVRAIAPWYKFGSPEMKNIGHGFPSSLTAPHTFVNARNRSSRQTIFQGTVKGHVLVKNVNSALLLKSPSFISVFGYNARQAYENGTFITWNVQSGAPEANPASDACLVFINAQATERWDRKNLTDAYFDRLVETVADQCANTIIIMHAAGIRLVDAWFNHPNITAVVFGHFPGRDSGRALVEVLYGRQSPSGRMPYTVAKQKKDYGNMLNPDFPSDDTPYYPQSNFTEGGYIDYKHFLKHNITPRFEFDFGLTYSSFEYSNLGVVVDVQALKSLLPPRPNDISPGGLDSLWDEVARVTCTVTNAGDATAAEVAQLYLGIPGGPAKVLRGFDKKVLEPGRSAVFAFPLTGRDVSTWDVVRQNWVLQRG
ncbi:hypothetical protein RB595_010714 [Gaeumannomyces hyphopodioides]